MGGGARWRLSPDGADGADNGGSGGKGGHKLGGDGKDALNNRETLFDSGNKLLLKKVLLVGSVGTEIHFVGWVG